MHLLHPVTAPRERPILFSAPMVRALLAGTKTQTRRVVKGAPEDWSPVQPQVYAPTIVDRHGDEQPGPDAFGAGDEQGDHWIRCPYGQPGDSLLCYHCAHEHQSRAETNSSVTERRLHGGVGRADLQPHQVQRIWAKGVGGLVSPEGPHDAQGLPDDLDVTRERESHEVSASADLHGISRHAANRLDGGAAPEWRCDRQQAGEPLLGNSRGKLAGQAGTWAGDGRGEAPSRQVHGRGAGAHPVGDSQRLVQPTSRSACSRCGAGINSGHRVGGDRLYVRETWAAPHAYDHLPPRLIPTDARIHYAATEDRGGLLWRPSIHMPRWASRITLEVTGVKVERLQNISEADAIAEGTPGGHGAIPGYSYNATPTEHYKWLWESINGPGSWDANPHVWCVSFKRLGAA